MPMIKDFAFMFYPGDYLRDTQCLSEKAQVAYDRIMCEHMRKICITQAQLNFFTKKLTQDEVDELLMVLTKVDGGFQIDWVVASITKRNAYSESRRKNRTKRHEEDMKRHDIVMEDEYEYILQQIIKNLGIEIQESQKNIFVMIVTKMVEVFRKHNPDYFFHQESDYSACLQIAYHIAQMKKWTKEAVLNGKMPDCLNSWETIVQFIKKDDWFNTRSLTDLSTMKEWQRLIQKMSKPDGKYKQPPQQVGRNNERDQL